MGSTAYLESDNSPPIQKEKRERENSASICRYLHKRFKCETNEGVRKQTNTEQKSGFWSCPIFYSMRQQTNCARISDIYLIMVVGKAIVAYPDGEVRGQQAVPQSQITAEVLRPD